ncbi:ubiquinol oxidase subunit II [Chromohalobacter sp. HP20-39]|uniref:ubiquinol oxidase subunit II n=1 Tax=Chromohalobacter sp. HP20-39 TaxID=3079306 RepID=UPI00294ADE38|nr:ubiquinol oxidase subunit II [Chromohalobacter sp. HP20-39]MDV6319403.1 ubiquinol oxidase subunit II [Chromohalobacter sp. HP20-39]
MSFLDPQGPIAAAQRGHYWFVVALSMIVVLPVLVLTPWLVWRYRYGGTAIYRPHWTFSRKMEWLIWGMPFLIVAVLSYVLWSETHALDPYQPLPSDKEPLRVQVVGYDWKWLFIYPEQGIATAGKLRFPADRPLALELTSNTVMQSFFIPALGSQIYAMNNMVTRLHLAADGPGTFRGLNAQYNGKHFHEQRFTAEALEPHAFSDFVEATHETGVPLSREHYVIFARHSTLREAELSLGDEASDDLIRFSQVPEGLFEAIVDGPLIAQLLLAANPDTMTSENIPATLEAPTVPFRKEVVQ